MQRVTIVDIARILGITPSTVSRALSGNPRVSEATRQKVKQLAIQYGYQPNHIATSLRKGKSDTIGMVVPRVNRHFFSHVISAVEEVLNPAGFNLIICQSNEIHEREEQAINTMIKNRVAGIIMSHAMESRGYSHVLRAIKDNIPVVQFDRVYKEVPGPRVVNDNFSGGYQAVNHLLKSGYKRVAHLTGTLTVNVYNERFAGYRCALEDNSIPFDPELIVEGAITRVLAYQKVIEIIDKKNVDAFFCAGDYSALGAIDGILEKQLRVGADIGVVGFANEPFSDIISPKLTTVEQNAHEIGKRVAKALIALIASEGMDAVYPAEIVPVTLLERESGRRGDYLLNSGYYHCQSGKEGS